MSSNIKPKDTDAVEMSLKGDSGSDGMTHISDVVVDVFKGILESNVMPPVAD